jgi:hypothetical protein
MTESGAIGGAGIGSGNVSGMATAFAGYGNA